MTTKELLKIKRSNQSDVVDCSVYRLTLVLPRYIARLNELNEKYQHCVDPDNDASADAIATAISIRDILTSLHKDVTEAKTNVDAASIAYEAISNLIDDDTI